MKLLARLFNSSLRKKYLMAITGMALLFFVVAHLIGNLQVFLGPEAINRYGHFLQSNLEIIWPARIGLLILIGIHIWSAIRLSAENKAARPVAYAETKLVGASYASRTMLMSGLIIFCFIVYHLLHYTLQNRAINLQHIDFKTLHDPLGRHDVYRMMVIGFSNIFVSLFYIVGVALLSLHLSHGISSMFQSLGWKKSSYAGFIKGAARSFSLFIFIGYISIPLAVLFGFLK